MPNYFTGHIDKWLLLSESETDFAILFVRSWIPFNAWYCNNYGSPNDRVCMDKVKADGNQFRARMIALLKGSDNQSVRFKAYVGQIHELLEQHPIPDASADKRISFGSIYFRENPTMSLPPQSKRNLEYKIERHSNGNVRAVVITKNRTPSVTRYDYSHNKYDTDHLNSDLQSSALNAEQKDFLADCFAKINPKKKESLLCDKRNGLCVGGVYFMNDCDLLSQDLVEVLYALRCKLFHGELQPSKDNLRVYEPAYQILRILLNSLR